MSLLGMAWAECFCAALGAVSAFRRHVAPHAALRAAHLPCSPPCLLLLPSSTSLLPACYLVRPPCPQVPSLRVESLRVLEVCTTLLKACAAAGLTLAEIAGVVTRPLIGMEEEPSELERICFNARAEVRGS